MAQAKKYVVLADIESVRVPFAAFAAALDELSRLGEIAGLQRIMVLSFKKMLMMHYQHFQEREKESST